MKALIYPRRRDFILALICCALFSSAITTAQTTATNTYARVLYGKVDPANVSAYLKIMKEQVKPALQQAKQSGDLTGWALYNIGFTSGESPYNFASVLIYDSWDKTERLPDLEGLLKKANPNGDAAGTLAQLTAIRKQVKQEFYHREDGVSPQVTISAKYILVDFMKPKPGMESAYTKEEREVWKPIHQEFVKSGQIASWALWSLIMPSGSLRPFDFVTVMEYENYSKINSVKFAETTKKVYPSKTPEAVFDQTAKTRDITRSEMWELIEQLQ